MSTPGSTLLRFQTTPDIPVVGSPTPAKIITAGPDRPGRALVRNIGAVTALITYPASASNNSLQTFILPAGMEDVYPIPASQSLFAVGLVAGAILTAAITDALPIAPI